LNGVFNIHAEAPAIRNQVRVPLGNPRAGFSFTPFSRIRMKRHSVKRRNAHPDFKLRCSGANPLYHFAQEARTILETATVLAFSHVRGEKFVTEVAVTMFDVDKIESQLRRDARCTMKIYNDGLDFTITEHWKIRRQS